MKNLINDNEVSFKIKVADRDPNKPPFIGEFRCLKRLPYRLQMAQDRIKREYLGEFPQHASQLALDQADIFATLSVSLTKVPQWWIASNNGLELDQDDVIMAIYKEVIKAQTDAQKEFTKSVEEDSKVLKEATKEPPVPDEE